MTTAALTASLTLKLQDLISGPLGKLTRLLDQLRRISSTISFDKLGEATGKLDKLARGADGVAGGLGRVKRMADEAAASVSRLGVIRVSAAGVASLPPPMLLPAPIGGRGSRSAPLMLGAPDASFSSVPESGAGGIRMAVPNAALFDKVGGSGFTPGDYARATAGLIGAAGQKAYAYGRGLGAAGAAMEGFAGFELVKSYAERENVERHIGITEGLSGPDLDRETLRLNTFVDADALRSGQSSASIVEAYRDLLTRGNTKAEVEDLLPAHTMIATAYNKDPSDLSGLVSSLHRSFGIDGEGMFGALASAAEASKSGTFNVKDMSNFMPTIGGTMKSLGMTGRASADEAFAALEIVSRKVHEPGQAATDFDDYLDYITSHHANRMFARRAGVDLPATLEGAAKRGINPLDASIEVVDKLTKGKTPLEQSEIINSLITNKGARIAALALIQDRRDFEEKKRHLHGVDRASMSKDFETAYNAPLIQLHQLSEVVGQLGRRIGQGLVPILTRAIGALRGLLKGVNWLDEKFPGLVDTILPVVGALLLFGAALGVIGFVAPAVAGGFRLVMLVLTPALSVLKAFGAILGLSVGWIALIAVAIVAAAYLIYRYWTPIKAFFERLLRGIAEGWRRFVEWFDGTLAGRGLEAFVKANVLAWHVMVSELTAAWTHFTAWFEGTFPAMSKGIDTLAGETERLFGAARSAAAAPGEGAQVGLLGRHAQVSGEITVRAAPGAEVVDAKSRSPDVRITPEAAPNRGPMLGRDRH